MSRNTFVTHKAFIWYLLFFRAFTLTELLLNNLENGGTESDPARIIHVSSMTNIRGKFDVDNPDFNLRKSPFNSGLQYATSKLLLLHYNSELARRLEGSSCETVALHPGNKFYLLEAKKE